jgi:hypothetical protein
MEDLKTFLIDKVLLFESDTLPPEAEKILQQVRREKPDKPSSRPAQAVSLQDRKRPGLQ